MTKQTAQLNYVRIAPRKMRQVARLLTGLSVNEAEAQLLLRRERAAKPLLKLLRSAVQNAKQNQRLDAHALVIERMSVDQGPMLKRMLPRARGMATPIQKKMSRVILVLHARPDSVAPRFAITVQKRAKVATGEKREKKEKTRASEAVTTRSHEKSPGFLRRFFRRKSV